MEERYGSLPFVESVMKNSYGIASWEMKNPVFLDLNSCKGVKGRISQPFPQQFQPLFSSSFYAPHKVIEEQY